MPVNLPFLNFFLSERYVLLSNSDPLAALQGFTLLREMNEFERYNNAGGPQ